MFQISGEAATWILMWNLVLAQMLATFQIYLAEIQIVLSGTKIIWKAEPAQNNYRFVMGQLKPSISGNSVALPWTSGQLIKEEHKVKKVRFNGADEVQITSILLGWPKILFHFFRNILQKNPNELFGQPSIYYDRYGLTTCFIPGTGWNAWVILVNNTDEISNLFELINPGGKMYYWHQHSDEPPNYRKLIWTQVCGTPDPCLFSSVCHVPC